MPDDIKSEMEEKKTLDVIRQFDASLTKMQNTQLDINKQHPHDSSSPSETENATTSTKLDDADIAHLNVPLETKVTYLTDNLKFNDNPLLNEDDKSKLIKILIKHWNCFDYYDNRLPKCSKSHVQHHINTGDSAPIKSKVRPLKFTNCR